MSIPMKTLLPAELRAPVAGQSPKGWDQIEQPSEVHRVLDRIRAATRYDVYQCAELYESAYPGYEGDAEYYLEKGKDGRVLYLGVGTGRIFSRLAGRNPHAVGIDNSPEMLELLRRRHPEIAARQVLQADAATAELPQAQFDSVLAPYSFLQVVGEDALPRLLKNVHRWLKPGGRFHADTFSPYLIPFLKKGLEASIRVIGADTRIAIYVLYDHLKQSMQEMAFVCRGGEEKLLQMNLHYYFPRELLAALRTAGFDEVSIAGGYRGESFDPSENEVIVYEARRREDAKGQRQAPSGNGRCPAPSRPSEA
jgi:SAM-dependent methyltransferase